MKEFQKQQAVFGIKDSFRGSKKMPYFCKCNYGKKR